MSKVASRRKLVLAGLLAGLPAAAEAADFEAAFGGVPAWQPWIELGGYWGSDNASRGEVVLWAPLAQNGSSLSFLDLRGKLFDDEVYEGNAAIGYRTMLDLGWNLGLWAGYDVRRSAADNVFHQVSAGIEALSPDWDLRLNGYLPVSDAQASGGVGEVVLSGNQIFMTGSLEVPLYGVDGEIGVRLLGNDDPGPGLRSELRVYGGGFWFDSDDIDEAIAGPKARAEWRIGEVFPSLPGSRLTLEGEFSYDEVRKDRWEAGVRLRIPIGAPSVSRYAGLSGQARRMSEGIERDTDIMLSQSGKEAVEDALTGVRFDQVLTIANGGDLAGETDDDTNFNTLIIAEGGGSDYEFITLRGDRTLLGAGGTIAVRGQKSGQVASFTADGTTPTISGTTSLVTFDGDNAHLAGFDLGLMAFSGSAVRINELANIAVTNATIATKGDFTIGIEVWDSTDILVAGNMIEVDTDRSGIFFSGTENARIEHNIVTTAHGMGIDLNPGNSSVAVADNQIQATNAAGIFVNFSNADIDILRNELTTVGSSADGILIRTGSSVRIADNRFVGEIGRDLVRFDGSITGGGEAEFLAGSTGNLTELDNGLGGVPCFIRNQPSGGDFVVAGMVEIGGVTYQGAAVPADTDTGCPVAP
jgi:hypothetical protein